MRPLTLLLLLLACFAFSCTGDRSEQPASVEGTVSNPDGASTNSVAINARSQSPNTIPVLKDVRIGSRPENGGWDRIVFEFEGGLPAGEVEYAGQIVQCGSGERVFVRGSGALLVRFEGAQAHNDAGRPTVQRTELPGTGNVIVQA